MRHGTVPEYPSKYRVVSRDTRWVSQHGVVPQDTPSPYTVPPRYMPPYAIRHGATLETLFETLFTHSFRTFLVNFFHNNNGPMNWGNKLDQAGTKWMANKAILIGLKAQWIWVLYRANFWPAAHSTTHTNQRNWDYKSLLIQANYGTPIVPQWMGKGNKV